MSLQAWSGDATLSVRSFVLGLWTASLGSTPPLRLGVAARLLKAFGSTLEGAPPRIRRA
jgi:hypothetical protein